MTKLKKIINVMIIIWLISFKQMSGFLHLLLPSPLSIVHLLHLLLHFHLLLCSSYDVIGVHAVKKKLTPAAPLRRPHSRATRSPSPLQPSPLQISRAVLGSPTSQIWLTSLTLHMLLGRTRPRIWSNYTDYLNFYVGVAQYRIMICVPTTC